MEYIYHAELQDNGAGGFIATFPDVPEAITEGKDKEEALFNAQDALGLALRCYAMLERPLPKAAHKGGFPVCAEGWDSMKLAVIEAFNEARITKTELAARLGRKEPEARRILDPDQMTKMQTLEETLHALGKQVVISITDMTPLSAAGR